MRTHYRFQISRKMHHKRMVSGTTYVITCASEKINIFMYKINHIMILQDENQCNWVSMVKNSLDLSGT